MENERELSMDEMEKVSGGSVKTVVVNGARVYSGAGKGFSVVGSLPVGAMVNFTGQVSYNSEESVTWFYINSPLSGWVKKNDISN